MDIKVETQDFEIINTGSAIVQTDDYLQFTFDNLRFRIIFTEELDDNGVPTESRYEFNVVGEDNNQYMEINNYNVKSSSFASYKRKLDVATLNNRVLAVHFCMQSINDDNEIIVFYTWYLHK